MHLEEHNHCVMHDFGVKTLFGKLFAAFNEKRVAGPGQRLKEPMTKIRLYSDQVREIPEEFREIEKASRSAVRARKALTVTFQS